NTVAGLGRAMYAAAKKRGLRWISDPLETTPAHLIRRNAREWEILDSSGKVETLGSDSAAIAAIAKLPRAASLFVQFPAPSSLVDAIAIGPIEISEDPDDADYVLVGSFANRKLSYAWLRPGVTHHDRRQTGLPLRTAWHADDGMDAVPMLRDAVMRLKRIHDWMQLESPPEFRSPYRLALRRDRTREWVRDSVTGEESYTLFLRAPAKPARLQPRYVYVFTIDSNGRSTLLFPTAGSVENHLPLAPAAPQEIALPGGLDVTPPYGVDTYVLLTTDEPLSNPWILEWNGVRGPTPSPQTPLEQLLCLTSDSGRNAAVVTPTTWSIERFVCESVAPRRKHAPTASAAPKSRRLSSPTRSTRTYRRDARRTPPSFRTAPRCRAGLRGCLDPHPRVAGEWRARRRTTAALPASARAPSTHSPAVRTQTPDRAAPRYSSDRRRPARAA